MSNWWDGMPIGEALRRGLSDYLGRDSRVVRVAPNLDATYWKPEFIEKVIREVESRSLMTEFQPFSVLEKFAIMQLASAAQIELDKVPKKEN